MLSRAFFIIFVALMAVSFSAFVYAMDGNGGPTNPYQVASWNDLQSVRNSVSSFYVLIADLGPSDANYSAVASSSANSGAGWNPIGTSSTGFSGRFDGNNHSITGLYINRATQYLGFFGYVINSADINNLALIDVNITNSSQTNTGGLAGYLGSGVDVNNCSVSGNVQSLNQTVGGLAGEANSARIAFSSSSATVRGTRVLGGFIGYQNSGTISKSYAVGDVYGSVNDVGGFIGIYCGVTIDQCYSLGDVNSPAYTGGFFGESHNCGGTISNSYARGNNTSISGDRAAMGGYIYSAGVNTSYATGSVLGMTYGGFIYWDVGCSGCTRNYYDRNTTRQSYGGTLYNDAYATGKSTVQMKQQATYTNWDFNTPGVWAVDASKNDGYPYLQWQTFGPNFAPDVNITKIDSYDDNSGLPYFSYLTNGLLTMQFDVSDANNDNLTASLYYSRSNAFDIRYPIVTDLNLFAPGVCTDTDFTNPTTCTYDWNIVNVTDGNYFVLIKVKDSFGLRDYNATDFNFGIDNSAPSVSVNYNSTWSVVNQSVTLSCADTNAGCAAIYYRVDDDATNTVNYGAWTQYSSAITFANDGNFALDFNAINVAGIWSNTSTAYVLVDRLSDTNSSRPNALVNSGMEMANFNAWDASTNTLAVDDCIGPSNGICISSSSPFAGSYSVYFTQDAATLSQEIDLISRGFSLAFLDASPDVNAFDRVKGTGVNVSDTYGWKVELRNSSHAVMATYDTGHLTATGSWQDLNYTFTGYPKGLRYIYFERYGDDAENQAGAYGPAFDGGSVRFSYTDTNTCMTLNSSHFGKSIFLSRDLNSGTWPSGGCFSLTQDANNQSITINCVGKTIDTFNANPLFDTNNKGLGTISFNNCNIVHDQSSSYLFYVRSDANYINLIDSNYTLTGSGSSFAYLTPKDNSLDFNLNGTKMSASSSVSNWGFNFAGGGDYNSFTVRDVNIWNTNTSSYSYVFNVPAGSDINYLNFINAQVQLVNSYSGILTYGATDNFIELNFDDTNLAYTAGNCPYNPFSMGGTIGTLNLRNWGVAFFGTGCQSCNMFSVSMTDLNYVNIIDSNITAVNGSIFALWGSDSFVDFNYVSSKMIGGYIGCIYHPLGSGTHTINVHGLTLDFNGWSFIWGHSSGRQFNMYLYDSNMFFYTSPYAYFAYQWDYAYFDINVYNNIIYRNPAKVFTQSSGAAYIDINFNTTLNLNNSITRTKIISDASTATGGNLWLNNSTGINLATLDNAAPFGIADTNIMVWGDDKNYYDFYPIIRSVINNYAPDINVLKIDTYPDNSALPFFNYVRDGNLTIDFNVTDYENDSLLLDINYSSSSTQGTGTVIANDINLPTASICGDTNFSDTTACSYDWNISGVNDGNYFILVSVYDGTTTTFGASDSNFGIDSTAPQVTANNSTSWYKTTASITLTCTDAVSGCQNTYYRADSDSTSAISYGTWGTYSSAISFATDGNYALDFNAVDNMSFWDDTNTIYVLVDKTAPLISVTPDTNQITVNSSYTITYFGTDAMSGIQNYYVSTNGTTYASTSDTNYVLRGANTNDTNTLYVKARDNADNNSLVSSISISFSSDTNDSDEDSVPDSNDTFHGNYSDINAVGFFGDVNVIVGGSAGTGSFSGINEVVVMDSDANVVTFDHNFSSGDLNLSKITITKGSDYVIVDLNGQLQSDQNKTVYIEDNSFVSLCVKDAEVTSISAISDSCGDTNEYNFTPCLGGNFDINGITCVDEGTMLKFSNLKHTAVKGVIATTENNNAAPGASITCSSLWSCTPWTDCNVSGKQTRKCLDITCYRTANLPTIQQNCSYVKPKDNNLPQGNQQDSNTNIGQQNNDSNTNNAPTCIEEWACTQWGACKDNKSIRACIDLHQCGTTNTTPIIETDCLSPNFFYSNGLPNELSWALILAAAIIVALSVYKKKKKQKNVFS